MGIEISYDDSAGNPAPSNGGTAIGTPRNGAATDASPRSNGGSGGNGRATSDRTTGRLALRYEVGHRTASPTRNHLRARLVVVDLVALLVAWGLFEVLAGPEYPPVRHGAVVVASLAVGIAAMAAARLYQARVSTVRSTELVRLGPVSLVAAAPVAAAATWDDPLDSLGQVLVLLVLLFMCLAAGRSVFDAWVRGQRERGRYCRPVVIVGTSAGAHSLECLLDDHPELGFRVVGCIGPLPRGRPPQGAAPWLGDIDDIVGRLELVGANGVMIASDALPEPQMNAVIRQVSSAGIHIHLSGGVWGLDHRRLRMVPIAHEPLLYVEPPRLGRMHHAVKRAVDIVLASAMLLLSAPLMLAAAVVIRLQDGGPALFVQQRVGRDGHPFPLYKLRTMTVDAAGDVIDLTEQNGREGPLFKAAVDGRVTRFGRFLRVTSIDELPQVINVIKGEMSLVGPRPALPSETERFDEELLLRNRVRPGLTGLWQVEARDNPSFGPYRRLDLFYVENWSLLLDIVILVQTVEVVLARSLRALRRGGATELRPAATTGSRS